MGGDANGARTGTPDGSSSVVVLHVDDEPGYADVAARHLEARSDRLSVATAPGVEEALATLAERPVDCVVSDYKMPGRDGLELLAAVREDDPELPFVLFTGAGSEEVASRAISAGVDDYLQKDGGTDQYAVLANRIETLVDRYRSERALASPRERLSLFVDQSPLGVLEWTTDFEVAAMNPAAEEILGYDEAELRGCTWEAIVPDGREDELAGVVEGLLADEGGYRKVNENVRADGEVITCEWHNRVVTDDDGEVLAVFSQFQDVTDRERRKRDLKRENERLDAFASVVSHDLRNPLNVATGNLEMVREERDDERLEEVAVALDRMDALVDDLLTLARHGQDVDDREPVDVAAIAEDCRKTVDTGDATVVVDADRTLRADRARLRQAVENLLRNAVEHGGASVTITVGELADGFYVADDGPGIPPDERDRVFQAGYSGDDVGSGLGLSIVRDVVEAHGWSIAVTESDEGGARFDIQSGGG